MGNILVFAETQKGRVPKSSLIAIQAGKDAASTLGGDVLVAVLGADTATAASEAAGYGAAKVLAVNEAALEHYLADAYAATLEQLVQANAVTLVVATATAVGKDLLPRLAARLGVGMASDVVGFHDDGTLQRPMYAGNTMATVTLADTIKVVSVRSTAFDAAQPGEQSAVEQVPVSLDADVTKMQFVEFNETKSDRPNLTEASIVVSGGARAEVGREFRHLSGALGERTERGHGCQSGRGGCWLCPQRSASGADRESRGTGVVYCGGNFRCDSALGRHEGLEGHCGGEQRPGRTDFQRG